MSFCFFQIFILHISQNPPYMKTIYSLFLLFLLSINANAQNDNPENAQEKNAGKSTDVKNILGLKIGFSDPVLALSYERLFSSHVGAEFQIGILGVSIGPKFYLPSLRPEKVNFHTGVVVGWGYFAQGMYTYLPIGINRLTKSNFMLSFDLGPQYLIDGEEFLPGFSLKVGKAF